MNRHRAWLLLFSLPVLAAGCSTESKAPAIDAEVAVKVEVATVADQPMPRFLTLTGSLDANRTSRVAADAMGTVRETYVERGSLVAKGAPLARLDIDTAAITASEARAQARAAAVQSRLAQAECERAEKLRGENVINQAEYDRITAQCQATAQQAAAAHARQRLAGKQIGDATVRAPFAGMIVERNTTVGEYVRPGQQIAVLVELDPLRLQLTVPEVAVGSVAEGQAVEFEVTALPGQTFAGTVRFIAPAVRAGSRDFVVEAMVANADHRLRPGMFATARLKLGDAPMPAVPATALRYQGELARVFVVVNGRLEERLISVGPRVGDAVGVTVGVRSGDKVVAKATPELRDGLKVE